MARHVLRPVSDHRRYVALAWASWMSVCVVVVARHEMWFDELQPWAIARSSHSLRQLFGNLQWEGHPPLWYLVLWPVSWVTNSPVAVQVANVIICGSAVLLILWFMPVSLWVRIAVVFGYIPMYETGVISRSYGLMVLLGVFALVLAVQKNWIILPAVLAVAMTGAVLLAGPLALGLVAALYVGEGGSHGWSPRRLLTVTTAASAVPLVGVLASPSKGGGPRWHFALPSVQSIGESFAMVTRVLVPIPRLQTEFWNTNLIDTLGRTFSSLAGIALICAVTLAVRRSSRALIVWVCASGGLIASRLFIHSAWGLRQLSMLWLALIIAIWLNAVDERFVDTSATVSQPVWARWFFGVVLSMSVLANAVAISQEIRYPFSTGERAKAWIERNVDPHPVVLCGTELWLCASVGIRLDTDVYKNAREEPSAFVRFRWGWRKRIIPPDRLADEAATLARRTGRKVVIVTIPGALPSNCTRSVEFSLRIVEPLAVCDPS